MPLANNRETMMRHWRLMELLPRQPRSIATKAIHERLEEVGFKVARRTVERDLLGFVEAGFPVVVDNSREPYLWSWDAAAPALTLPVPSVSDALLLAMVRDYLGPMLPPQMLDALRPYLDRAVQVLDGAKNIIGFNVDGVIHPDMSSDDPMQRWFIEHSNKDKFKGTMSEALVGADVFIGVSASNILVESDIAAMAKGSIVFALANPDPEIDPALARKHATVVATGRSDQPNQINNVLAFPGIFRGLLDANAHKITDELLVAAATAIADCVSPEQLNSSFIVPSVFDANVVTAVASAVRKSV